MRCDGKVVLVAGGGSGIGRAAAVRFAREGGTVAIADRDAAAAEGTAELVRAEGGQVRAWPCDITDRAQTDDCAREVVEHFGRIDIAVSTVGWSDTTFFMDETEEYWARIVDVNLMGAIRFTRSVLEHLRAGGGGSIVLTSSDAGKVGTMGETVYAAAKAGVIGFVKSLAREVARDGVRVNAISPGPTDTPLLRSQSHQGVIDRMVKAIPLKRMGTADEQASAIVFLASDDAAYVTGQTLSVSGGLTMTS